MAGLMSDLARNENTSVQNSAAFQIRSSRCVSNAGRVSSLVAASSG